MMVKQLVEAMLAHDVFPEPRPIRPKEGQWPPRLVQGGLHNGLNVQHLSDSLHDTQDGTIYNDNTKDGWSDYDRTLDATPRTMAELLQVAHNQH